MPALAKTPVRLVSQRLIELLEETRGRNPIEHGLSFHDRLDALEIEALSNCMPESMLVMIRAAREAAEFGERIVGSLRRA